MPVAVNIEENQVHSRLSGGSRNYTLKLYSMSHFQGQFSTPRRLLMKAGVNGRKKIIKLISNKRAHVSKTRKLNHCTYGNINKQNNVDVKQNAKLTT